ncbi:MAG: PAN domain-containing protein [Xanthobacteraceae bacterium]
MLIRCFGTVLAFLVAFISYAAPARAQVGYDRPGGDYSSFSVRSGDPAVCAARCEREGRCRAWSFVYPTSQRGAVCWLKSHVSPRVEDGCCVSGVRGAGVIAPRDTRREYGIDRSGGDYRSFEVQADPTGRSCLRACEADGRCRAWTYARPGYFGPAARCYLKDRVRPPRRRPCCISGVVK